uniref:Uncharacterized protein n=1 Tax=Magallana gigas TaxID=29159 RepID=A0A8W8KDI9_MAGGI
MSDSDSGLLGGDTDKSSSTPAADITDTFNLFKCYLDSSLNSFKKELLDSQEADNSPAGWATVHQYEHNDIASDSDDDKKLPVIDASSVAAGAVCQLSDVFQTGKWASIQTSGENLADLKFFCEKSKSESTFRKYRNTKSLSFIISRFSFGGSSPLKC